MGFAQTVPYNGGPVMVDATNYIIWYGLHWNDNPGKGIVERFIIDFSESPWMETVSTYYAPDGRNVSSKLKYGGSTEDTISRGTSLYWRDISLIVEGAIASGKLPLDVDGIYHVLTSWEVDVEDFKRNICGRHGSTYVQGKLIKYEFTGDAGNILACQPMGFGPNGLSGADGMISVIAHEIAEVMTDPCADNPGCRLGWVDEQRGEIADLCGWKYGQVYRTSNGAWANARIRDVDYLIQQNWVNGAGCVSSWTKPTSSIFLENVADPGNLIFRGDDAFRLTIESGPGLLEVEARRGLETRRFALGNIVAEGKLVLTGVIDGSLVGDWRETFYVDGVRLPTEINFSIK